MGFAYSEEFKSESWYTLRICAVANIVCNSCELYCRKTRRGVVNKLMCADGFVVMSENTEEGEWLINYFMEMALFS